MTTGGPPDVSDGARRGLRTMARKASEYQNTLGDSIEFEGVGVHSGSPVTMTLHPADPNTGIVFSRTDIEGSPDIPAHVSAVSATALCTVLGDPRGAHVMTVEHLMAALRALNVDNVLVEVDRPEIPVMDGSSEVFVRAIEAVGLVQQAARRRYIRVLKDVRVDNGGSWATFSPHDTVHFDVEIDFPTEAIGRQVWSGDMNADSFRESVMRARTFGFMRDVERLWAAGFALGSSLENSVVIGDDDRVVNPEGLRYEEEFVAHKTLDAVGDLALAGAPILGRFRSHKGGHAMNAMALKALLADETAWEWTDVARPTSVSAGIEMLAAAGAAYAASKV